MSSGVRSSALACALALAALGCGRGHGSDVPDASIDGAGPDVSAVCPIASCVAKLRAAQSACPLEGIACTTTSTGISQINDCFANGVEVHVDGNAETQTATVVAPDGRVCYAVLFESSPVSFTFTVLDPGGQVIIRELYDSNDTSTYACPDGTTFVEGTDRPCGVVRTYPEDRQCITGVCVRP